MTQICLPVWGLAPIRNRPKMHCRLSDQLHRSSCLAMRPLQMDHVSCKQVSGNRAAVPAATSIVQPLVDKILLQMGMRPPTG